MWVEYENKSNHIQPMHKAAQKENYPFSITGVEYQRIFVPLHSKAIKGLYFGIVGVPYEGFFRGERSANHRRYARGIARCFGDW